MTDPSRNGYEATHEAVRRVLEAEATPLRQVAAVVGIAADDGAEAWESLAGDLGRVAGNRWAVLKARSKARLLARTCRKLRADIDRVLGATDGR